MLNFKHAALLITLSLLCSCSPRVITNTEVVYLKDTLSVTVNTRDTVFLASVPEESVCNQTKDTVSHLETAVATSDASVSDGILTHTLENKKTNLKTEVVTLRDTVYVQSEVRYYPKYVEVEKVPSAYKTLLEISLYANILLACLILGYLCCRWFGKKS